MDSIDWEKLLQIDDKWIAEHLLMQKATRNVKMHIRGYTIKFRGTQYNSQSFTAALSEIIGQFTHSKFESQGIGELKAHKNAEKIFGDINPTTDGKYGELILFALVESVLRCPMISHKIPSNFHDQVKGSDGIFIGRYEYEPNKYQEAILIGESKIWQQYSTALDSSMESINRFHKGASGARFSSQEFIVARKGIVNNPDIDPDILYKYLSPKEEEHRNCAIVHPVFIMYETKKISPIEAKALTIKEAEALIKQYMQKTHISHTNLINKKIIGYPELKNIFLDFFIIPVKSVDDFRKELFLEIHGIEYKASS